MIINEHWFGTLTAENIEVVANEFRKILDGKKFAVAECLYADSLHAELQLQTDCEFDSTWTDDSKEMVRVMRPKGGEPYLAFSTGGYFYSFGVAPTPDHDDFRYPRFKFDTNKVEITQRAPAGAGHLHKHIFGIQEKS